MTTQVFGWCGRILNIDLSSARITEFETMRKEFYDLRGLDTESGLQKAETLERLGLSDLVQDLARIDMIAK